MTNTIIGLIAGIIIAYVIIVISSVSITKKYKKLYEIAMNDYDFEKALSYIQKGEYKTDSPEFTVFQCVLHFNEGNLQAFVDQLDSNPNKLNKLNYETVMPLYKISNYILGRENVVNFSFNETRIDLIIVNIERFMKDANHKNAKKLVISLKEDRRQPVIMFVYCVLNIFNDIEPKFNENQLEVIDKLKEKDIYRMFIKKLQENENEI